MLIRFRHFRAELQVSYTAMELEWDAPPEENFDALMEDEDEMEYIREMEMEQRKLQNVENELESTKDNVSQSSKSYDTNRKTEGIEDEVICQNAKRAKISNSICNEINLSPSPPPSITFSPNKRRPPFKEISNQNSHEGDQMVSNDGDTTSCNTSYRIPQMGERKFYRRIPRGTDFQSITMEDGEKFYIRLFGSHDDFSIATQNA